eukprot:1145932-Pelagomonas_calceolata.AAC.4
MVNTVQRRPKHVSKRHLGHLTDLPWDELAWVQAPISFSCLRGQALASLHWSGNISVMHAAGPGVRTFQKEKTICIGIKGHVHKT